MEMYCKDTDTFVCTPFVGGTRGTSKNVTVNVVCEPEISSSSTSIDHSYHSTIEGKTLEIRFIINSYPPPTSFELFQTGNLTEPDRKKREATRNQIPQDVYEISCASLAPPQDMVVLQIYNWKQENSGQFALNIQNGIGRGVDINFSVDVKKEDDDDEVDIHTIIGTVCGVIGAIGMIAPGVYCIIQKYRA